MKTIHKTKSLQEALARIASLPGASRDNLGARAVRIRADLEGVWLSRSSGTACLHVLDESATTEDDGEVMVSFAQLQAIASRTRSEEIILESKKSALVTQGGKASGETKLLAASEWPQEIGLSGGDPVDLVAEELLPLLEGAASHASKMEADKGLCGVAIQTTAEGLAIIGCDRKRMFYGTLEADAKLDVVISLETVAAISAALGHYSGAVTLTACPNAISVKAGAYEAVYAVMDFGYPDALQQVRHVESLEVVNTIKVNREDFLKLISAVAPFGGDDTYRSIIIHPHASEVEVIGQNEQGAFRESMGATCQEGPPIKFNSSALRDTIGSLAGGSVTIRQLGLGLIADEPGRKVFASAMKLE